MSSPNVILDCSKADPASSTDTLVGSANTSLATALDLLQLPSNMEQRKELIEAYARDLFINRPQVHIYSSSLFSFGRLKAKVVFI
jgi:hypothetical protein